MLNRNKNADDIHLGKWNGLGGKLLAGESPEECVIREVKEESGFEINHPTIRGILTFPQFADNEDWYVYVFTAEAALDQVHNKSLISCSEGTLQWIETSKLLSLNLWEGDKYFLDWIQQKRFFSAKFNYIDKKLISHQVVFHNND